MRLRNRHATLGVALALLLSACDQDPQAAAPTAPDIPSFSSAPQAEKIGPGVLEALRSEGSARIMIALQSRTPPGLSELRQEVAAAQSAALQGISQAEFATSHRYQAVPALAGLARSEAALLRMAANPRVQRIDLDVGGQGMLATSVPLIGADTRHTVGNDGEGVVVAVLDSGIDTDHPDLSDDLNQQACFGDNNSSIDGSGFCPNGSDRQTGPGAAEDDQGHGTHVSGIITSNGTVAPVGVAPGANIVAIKVLSSTGAFFAFSEIVAAMDYIINNNATLGVSVINMSLGTFATFAGDCDLAASPPAFVTAGAAAVNTLRTNGVLTVASAGNSSRTTEMGLPACLSNVISVGASDDADAPASFTNSSTTTDLFAPGVAIESSSRGGGSVSLSGTSMSSPHVASCAALLIDAGDATTPAALETRLETSSVTVTHASRTYPRLDCTKDENLAPTANANGPYSSNEGSSVLFDATGSSDPESAPLTYEWDVDYDGVTFNANLTGASPSHSYAQDGTYTVALRVSDGSLTSPISTATATVANVLPSVTVTGPSDPVGLTGTSADANLLVSFTDPGTLDPHTTTVQCGNSTTGSATATPGTYACTYITPGVYTVSATVTDDDGSTTETFEYVVVYDPSAGFVTGGGWILYSDASCPVLCGGTAGQGHFGFVSKYKKGATVPSGDTKFVFHAGSLTFYSTVQEWLVVADGRAQYRGSGQINGGDSYNFQVTAVDGTPDAFRIRIWEPVSGDVVFDNQMAADIAGPAATQLDKVNGNGSIIIHKGGPTK